MKKIIAMVLILTVIMGTTTIGLAAKGETCDNITTILKKNVINPELAELQAKADELFKDSNVVFDAKTIEAKGVSSGKAKYSIAANEEEHKSWFEAAIDWVTFWN